jgi:hypothetical protein
VAQHHALWGEPVGGDLRRLNAHLRQR